MSRLTNLPRSNLYVIYSMSNSPYQQWQSDLLDFSVGEVNQPGVIVRLCSREDDHANLEVKPSARGYTFVTPSFAALGNSSLQNLVRMVKRWLKLSPFGRYHFYCLNKPYAMKAFLEAHTNLDDEVQLMWLDPDMVFSQPWTTTQEMVRQGHVTGQRWWGYDRSWLLRHTGDQLGAKTAVGDSALMFPFCITVGDMRRISGSFCNYAREVYRMTRDWESEMYALAAALATSGLRCHTVDALGTCNNWPQGLPDDPSAPISHYTQPIMDARGGPIWDKRAYTPQTLSRPWGRPPSPDQAATLTDRRTLKMLHRFIDWQEENQHVHTPSSALS